jgi:hypothetical protein
MNFGESKTASNAAGLKERGGAVFVFLSEQLKSSAKSEA